MQWGGDAAPGRPGSVALSEGRAARGERAQLLRARSSHYSALAARPVMGKKKVVEAGRHPVSALACVSACEPGPRSVPF